VRLCTAAPFLGPPRVSLRTAVRIKLSYIDPNDAAPRGPGLGQTKMRNTLIALALAAAALAAGTSASQAGYNSYGYNSYGYSSGYSSDYSYQQTYYQPTCHYVTFQVYDEYSCQYVTRTKQVCS
jgi:hypothetical protein